MNNKTNKQLNKGNDMKQVMTIKEEKTSLTQILGRENEFRFSY